MRKLLCSSWPLRISLCANLAVVIFYFRYTPPTTTHATHKLRVYEVLPHPLDLANAQQLVADLRSSKAVSISPINFRYANIKFSEDSMECSEKHKEQFSLLILVKTRRSEGALRNISRQVLQNETILSQLGIYIQYGFLVGESPEDITEEIDEHDDFIIGDFEDTYQNLTYKSMMGYRWAMERCPDFNFFISLDVDTHIFLNNLVKFLKDPYKYPNVTADLGFEQILKSSTDFFAGFVFPSSYPVRNNASKWYLSEKDYPASVFPPYIAGMIIILSKETVSNFYYLSPYVQHISVDDAYFGILADKLGIVPFDISKLVFEGLGSASYSQDFFKQGGLKDVLTVHHFEFVNQYLQKKPVGSGARFIRSGSTV